MQKQRNYSPAADSMGGRKEISRGECQTNGIIAGISAYNEEIAIGSIVLQAQDYADEVIVVDDGSSDETASIAAKAGASVIQHDENRGKGGAIQTLLGHVQHRDFDALVLLDGDGQHIPNDIPDVIDPVLDDDYDVSIGSRYLNQEKTETPAYRRFGQRVLDLMTLGSARRNVSDSQSGFRALSAEAVSRLTIRTDGMGVESEMINSAVENGLEMTEVPIDVRYEEIDGQTHNPLRHGLAVLVFILRLIRDRHPLLFFGVPGIVALGVGGAFGLHTSWLYHVSGAFYQWRVITSAFLILLGTLSLFCGLVLSQIQNMIGEMNE